MSCLADKESFEECEGGSYSPWKYEAQVSSLWAHQSGYKRSPVSSSIKNLMAPDLPVFTCILFVPHFFRWHGFQVLPLLGFMVGSLVFLEDSQIDIGFCIPDSLLMKKVP